MSIQQNFPAISPSLSLNFARSKTLDPRITFTRTSSATRINETGLVEVVPTNAPRFDHSYDPVSGSVRSLGLLVEEQRSNLVTYSDNFGISSSIWRTDNLGTTVLDNQDISPDGQLTADRLYETTSALNHTRYQSAGLVSTSTSYTWSVFAKSGTRSKFSLSFGWAGVKGGGRATFDLSTSTVYSVTLSADGPPVSIDAEIKNYGNGWHRCSMSLIPTNSGNTYFCGIFMLNDSYSEIYTGDISNYISIWGAQLEQGSFPTSYIPTTNSTVTRTADNVSMVGDNFSSWYNQSEGTVFVRYVVPSFPFTNRTVFGISSSFSNRINARLDNKNIITPYIITNNLLTSVYNLAINSGTINSTAYTFSENNSQSSTNGTLAVGGTQQSVSLPTCDTFSIGSIRNVEIFCSTISQLTYYPRRLTNAQLQTLTR